MQRFWFLCFFVLFPSLPSAADLPIGAAAANPPWVILITIDTVRADRMGFLGSKRGLTPHLDALAAQSVVFERAYSQAPLTPVSHATILTGTYPRFHGVRDFGSHLPASPPYLPELLRTHGYRTGAFVSSIILDPTNGFAPGFERGFDTFDAGFHRGKRGEPRIGSMQRRGEDTTVRALRWLEKDPHKPAFLWIHIWDAHDPYDPPSPFKERYPNTPYDGCIAYVDATLGKLFAELRAAGIYDQALIAVMSDHGESLGEHGENTHGVFLYDSTIHVPLLIKFPNARFAKQKVSARANLADVTPTILDALRISAPAAMQGQSLIPLIGAKDSPDRTSFAENEYTHRGFGWSSLEALRAENFLFVKAPQPELYDQLEDPGEKINLFDKNKLASVRMAIQLDRFGKRVGANAPETTATSLDPQSVEKLRALGYMASSGAETSTKGQDPKLHIQVSNDLHDANLRIEEGQETAAIPLLERVVAEDPRIPHAQYFLGVAYKEIREYDKAILHLNKAIQLVPDSMMGQYEMALALYAKGDLQTAATHLEVVVAHSPDWADARFSLAAIYARSNRLPEALALLDSTLELDPDHYRAHLLRGRILSLQNHAADGLSDLEKAVSLEPKSKEAHQFLADAYEQLGQDEKAAAQRSAVDSVKP
jgi:arylsulfatase A-like enzyme/Flp pilus assembly protein TadD